MATSDIWTRMAQMRSLSISRCLQHWPQALRCAPVRIQALFYVRNILRRHTARDTDRYLCVAGGICCQDR